MARKEHLKLYEQTDWVRRDPVFSVGTWFGKGDDRFFFPKVTLIVMDD